MFDNHCNSCDSNFDVITQLKETEKIGIPNIINYCPKCGNSLLLEVET